MLRIKGPAYRYQGETTSEDIIYIDDHCYDEQRHEFPVQHLLEASGGQPLLVFDHLGHDDVLARWPHIHLPVYLAAEVESFRRQNIQCDWQHKTHCFNFMINKPRPNRIQLLNWIEQHQLTNRLHALPWTASQWPSIPVTDFRVGNEVQLEQGIRNGSYSNATTYQTVLQKAVFEPTCVSVITEPCYYERESMITEKTVMAIYAGTLPLWAGGWRLPDVMRDLGFDVFDDVIDHSYSDLDDPQQRFEQAMTCNQHLLQDFDTVKLIVQQNQSRLQHNLDLLQSNVFLAMVYQQVQQDPRLDKIAKFWGLDSAGQ